MIAMAGKSQLISITEYARLRGVTTETLRHYGRIGLLKPAYIDPDSRVRYYSLAFADEKLGTILQLRQLDMVVGFSFMGTELVTVAAGESENPSKNIPKAIKSVFWRILIFYIGTIFVIACTGACVRCLPASPIPSAFTMLRGTKVPLPVVS